MPIQPGSAIVFTKEGILITSVFETEFFFGIQFAKKHKSHVGLRGLVYKVKEDFVLFIGPDSKYYKFENKPEIFEFLIESSEEGDDNPPKADPYVRAMKPTLLAQDIVSVQPMTAPLGAIFYLDYTYGTKHEQNKSNNRTSNTQRVGRFLRRTKPGKPYQRACCGYKRSRERKHDNSANCKGNLSTGCVKD